ncbi:MAG: hypothetical protein ACXACX_04335 [Candidatus Hodarchaeales archaeon]
MPVNADTHADEVIGIGVDFRMPLVPSPIIFLSAGSFPSLAQENSN